ncbi:hypothetical protein MICA_1601 [Micavibrio aeruginosavorus ARL-13]|uniref:Uncharacterized protein n=1 Tax=Micavibrio aeruginosavorus (strain ARL-13) TaxID=856793 RepID=G2KPU7_MICAA|nr:hypothetical protein MICA_1601 [Micavibrio aeruginosavorus ARL-13]
MSESDVQYIAAQSNSRKKYVVLFAIEASPRKRGSIVSGRAFMDPRFRGDASKGMWRDSRKKKPDHLGPAS